MKRILTAAALLLVVAACNEDENYNDKYGDKAVIPPKGRSLRVMTYNIYGARATSPANAADLDALAEVIRRQDPDFVTLNEVDVFTDRTGKDVHQARDLAEKLGMEWHFSKAIDRDGGEYGDAVLSKYPILETRSYRLPCAAEQPGEDRALCVIRVQIDGKDLYVASTHLDHLSGDASRLVQAAEIRRIRDTELEGDLILCGDLNAIPSSNVIATMTSFLTNTGTDRSIHLPVGQPRPKDRLHHVRPDRAFRRAELPGRVARRPAGRRRRCLGPPSRDRRHPLPDRRGHLRRRRRRGGVIPGRRPAPARIVRTARQANGRFGFLPSSLRGRPETAVPETRILPKNRTNMKKILSTILALAACTTLMAQDFKITHGPWLCDLTSDGVTVVWATSKPALSWVEVAEDDGRSFYAVEHERRYETVAGRKQAHKTLHSIRLKGLRPGTKYRYRIFSQEVREWKYNDKVYYGDIAASNVYSRQPFAFRTLPASGCDLSFVVLNDIHGRADCMAGLCRPIDFAQIDFVAFNGDMSNSTESPGQLYRDFIDASVGVFASETPILYNRGNHETRGSLCRLPPGVFPQGRGLLLQTLHGRIGGGAHARLR